MGFDTWFLIMEILLYVIAVFVITTLPYTFLTKKQKESEEKNLKGIIISYIKSVRLNIKPIIISVSAGFIIVSLLFNEYGDTVIILPFPVPIIGDKTNWIICYTIISLPFLLIQALYIRYKMR